MRTGDGKHEQGLETENTNRTNRNWRRKIRTGKSPVLKLDAESTNWRRETRTGTSRKTGRGKHELRKVWKREGNMEKTFGTTPRDGRKPRDEHKFLNLTAVRKLQNGRKKTQTSEWPRAAPKNRHAVGKLYHGNIFFCGTALKAEI